MEEQADIRLLLGLPPAAAEFDFEAALYFLPDGHFLFRHNTDAGLTSKFVTAADVAAAFSKQENDTGWIGQNILRCGYGEHGPWFTYYIPMQKVCVVLGEAAITIPTPPLVLFGSGRQYALFAMKEKHFDPSAQLYAAPFPNVGDRDGVICWGNTTPPEASHSEAGNVWKLFLEARFTEHTIQNKSKAHPDDIRLTLHELAQAGKKAYPLNDLTPLRGYRTTTESMLREFTKSGG